MIQLHQRHLTSSIEGTSTSGLRQLSAAPHVTLGVMSKCATDLAPENVSLADGSIQSKENGNDEDDEALYTLEFKQKRYGVAAECCVGELGRESM